MANIATPRPFRVEIPQENVDRLKRLVQDTRLPDRPFTEGVSWNYGADLDWLKSMRKEWIENFDWRQVEAEMNQFPQFKVTIESVDVHFIHQRSERADAIPLILMHGWPGSFWEFHKVIESLANPPAEQPAFHVVVPSLPGFGFSSPPPKQEWGMDDNARVFDRLMTGVLGYQSYMAEAGDFGALVATYLGTNEYPSCKLLNICATPANPTIGALLTLPFWLLPTTWRQWLYSKIYTEVELKGLSRVRDYLKTGLGYFIEQATQPMTIGYALHDSPIGLLAWIGEKYKELVDPEVLPTATNFILTTVSLYYLTGSFVTSTLPYHENTKTFSKTLKIVKPLGVSHFPYDCLNVPLGWIKSQHRNVVFYRHHTRGGHFPAFEVPELLVSDVRELLVAQRSVFD